MTRREPYLAARLQGFGTTIFAEMSALAVRTGAINLGQGFPDTDGPAEVADAAVAAIRAGHNQYPPGPGIPELRAAVARHQKRFWGIDVDPDTEVLVTAGATEAVAAALARAVRAGRRGGRPRADLRLLHGVRGDGRRPAAARHAHAARPTPSTSTPWPRPSRPQTRLLLLNSPHNPTGTVLSRRRAGRHRPPVRRARPAGGHRRGLRAPRLRRRAPARWPPARAWPSAR